MNCKEFHKNLPECMEKTISGKSLAEMEMHRDACPSCRSLWENVGSAMAFALSDSVISVSSGYDELLNSRLSAAGENRIISIASRRKVFTSFAIAASLVAGVFLGRLMAPEYAAFSAAENSQELIASELGITDTDTPALAYFDTYNTD